MTIKVDNMERFVLIPDHLAAVEGTVSSAIGGDKRPIEGGMFNLLVDTGDPSHKKMLYRLHFSDANGNPLTLSGFKDVHDDAGGDVWADTTTLFTHIYDGHETADQGSGRPAARDRHHPFVVPRVPEGVNDIGTQGATLGDRASALARFGALFLGELVGRVREEGADVQPVLKGWRPHCRNFW